MAFSPSAFAASKRCKILIRLRSRGKEKRIGPKNMRLPRWLTGLLLGLVLIGCVVGGLTLVSPWHAPEVQSCPDFIHFPRWLGCTMTAHETLAGGLVAAAGALFGAWLAFSAIQDQIGMTRENERLARQVANDRQKMK